MGGWLRPKRQGIGGYDKVFVCFFIYIICVICLKFLGIFMGLIAMMLCFGEALKARVKTQK